MKILFTGCTTRHVDDTASSRARTKKIDDSTIMVESLRKSGHVVERRTVEWGDDLSEYDIAIIGISPIGSFNSRHVFNSMWAMDACKNVVLFHEDWKIDSTIKNLRSLSQGIERLYKCVNKRTKDGSHIYSGVDNPQFDLQIAYQVVRNIVNGKYDYIVPAFKWGDSKIIADVLNVKESKIHRVDASGYVFEDYFTDLYHANVYKINRYGLASLVDHTRWVKSLGLTLEVDYFGCRKLKNEIIKDERTVAETMAKYRAILIPKYPHAGSGWFRSRYIYGALNRNVMIMDSNDFRELDLPIVRRIEDLSNDLLNYLANQQSRRILSYSPFVNEDGTLKNFSEDVTSEYDEVVDGIVRKIATKRN